jgi:hypothetical protein
MKIIWKFDENIECPKDWCRSPEKKFRWNSKIASALDFLPPFDMASSFNEQLFAVLLGSHTVPLTGIKIGARKTKNTFLLICRKSGNHGVWMGGSSLRQLTRSPLEHKMKNETRKIPF